MYYVIMDQLTANCSMLVLENGLPHLFSSFKEADEAGLNAVYQELAKTYEIVKICISPNS